MSESDRGGFLFTFELGLFSRSLCTHPHPFVWGRGARVVLRCKSKSKSKTKTRTKTTTKTKDQDKTRTDPNVKRKLFPVRIRQGRVPLHI